MEKKKKVRKQWMTPSIYKQIQDRNKLFQEFLRLKDSDKFNEYKRYGSKLNMEIRKEFDGVDDSTKLWNIYNEICHSKPIHLIPDEITFAGKAVAGRDLSKKFDQDFLTCGRKLNNTIKVDPSRYMDINCSDTLYLMPTSEFEIINIIESINSKTAAVHD